jgi:chemotaxis response regulator CheB
MPHSEEGNDLSQPAAPAERLYALLDEIQLLRERGRLEQLRSQEAIARARELRRQSAKLAAQWSVLAADTDLPPRPFSRLGELNAQRPIPQTVNQEPTIVVAIGCSAGGLPALCALLGGLPADFPGAIVVAQHDTRAQLGLLPCLLRGRTALPVGVLTAGERPRAGAVRLAPGGHHLTFDADGRSVLRPAAGIRPHRLPFCPSIDLLFRSLADVYGDRAIAVVLSGMATDGALACRAVLERSGVVITQQARSARYAEMPTAAADLSHPDLILPPSQIGAALDVLARDPARLSRADAN